MDIVGAVGGFEPPTLLTSGLKLIFYVVSAPHPCRCAHPECALPSELHDTPYICIASPKPSELFCPFGHPFLSSFAFCFSFRLLLCHSNHSTFNSHNFPRTYTTTYPYVAAPPQPNALTRKAQGFGTYLVSSGCTYGLDTVSFHSICVEVSFATVSAQSFARSLSGLLATHLAIVYSVYSAYLPGLLSARPSALVAVDGLEPSLILLLHSCCSCG